MPRKFIFLVSALQGLVFAAEGLAAAIVQVANTGVSIPVQVDQPNKGVFLVASEDMLDPWFQKSVVFILSHGDGGTLGLIINRPTNTAVVEVLPELKGADSDEQRLFWGGPVAMEGALFLARSQKPLVRGDHIVDDVYGSADLATLQKLLASNRADSELRLYIGHAGWAPGQLDAEIAEGAWYLFKADSTTVFHDKPEAIWAELMRHQGKRQIMVWLRH